MNRDISETISNFLKFFFVKDASLNSLNFITPGCSLAFYVRVILKKYYGWCQYSLILALGL